MILIYNILQILFLALFAVPLIFFCIVIPKYRKKTLNQLGLSATFPSPKSTKKRIWVHALSVGEVTTALPLLAGIRNEFPNIEICFSATTTTGIHTAKSILNEYVDYYIPSPLDLYPVVHYFHKKIQPDLYIHIETDFWPNHLYVLQQRSTPSILANGRISVKSFNSYKRFKFFFRPLFSSFNTLSMQTESDRKKMLCLGICEQKVKTLGNLKFDLLNPNDQHPTSGPSPINFPEGVSIIVAGSTHEGEERILITALHTIKKQFDTIQLVIAPRDIGRGTAIEKLAIAEGFSVARRSKQCNNSEDIFIIDTLGELYQAYQCADIAFVGGSLVKQGGHNPIEPASCGIPILFGVYMDDFEEVSYGLLQANSATKISTAQDFSKEVLTLLDSPNLCKKRGQAGKEFITAQQGVVKKHLAIIKTLL